MGDDEARTASSAVGVFMNPAIPGRPLILCIDDNASQLRLLDEILGRQGFQVLQASTVETALETMREAPISLVISDHFLRGTSGTELAEKLKALKPTVPILLHSGAHPDTMRNVDAFINKGESVKEFIAVACDLIKRFST